jgi:WD40 repeat protein
VQLTIEDSGAPVTSMGFNGDGSLLVAGTSMLAHRTHEPGYGVTVWDTATGEARTRLAWDPAVSVYSADLSPDGSMVVTVDQTGGVQLWDAADGALLGPLPPTYGKPREAQFSPDGTLVGAVTGNGSAFWDVEAPGEPAVLLDNGYSTAALAFDPGDRYVAALEDYPDFEREYELTDSRIAVWDYEHQAFAASLPHSSYWYAMAITPDSRTLYAADETGIAYYDLSYLEGDLHALACEQADYELSELDWAIQLPDAEPGSIDICP